MSRTRDPFMGTIPIPGESGGPPYGQYHGSRIRSEDLLRHMAEAAQSGDFDYLMEGDVVRGPSVCEPGKPLTGRD